MGARLIVLGRQGSGKGTQCARLAARLGIPHLSTGDLFRAEIATGTPRGRLLDRYVAAGELVPDDLVLDVVAAQLGDADARRHGYLLDGFPRTLAQGQALFEVLGAGAADVAVELDVPVDVVVRRLAARRVCDGCGAVTSVPDGRLETPCEACGGIARRRDDDHPEAIARRLALYEEQAGPLLVWLHGRGLLVTVPGTGDEEVVHRRLLDAVGARVPALRAAGF